MKMPRAVKEGLVVRELAGELMVHDKARQKTHCLNPTSAWVWRHCDGRTLVGQLAQAMHEELGLPRSEELVHLALDQLARRHLLQGAPPARDNDARRSRRDALKALAVAVASLPVIMTMASKTARAATKSATIPDPANSCHLIYQFSLTHAGFAPAGTSCIPPGFTIAGQCDGNGNCVGAQITPIPTTNNPPPPATCTAVGQACGPGSPPCPTGCRCIPVSPSGHGSCGV